LAIVTQEERLTAQQVYTRLSSYHRAYEAMEFDGVMETLGTDPAVWGVHKTGPDCAFWVDGLDDFRFALSGPPYPGLFAIGVNGLAGLIAEVDFRTGTFLVLCQMNELPVPTLHAQAVAAALCQCEGVVRA
jgi:hypothetical protein